MRLFHVSEEPDIEVFEPRLPKRKDLGTPVIQMESCANAAVANGSLADVCATPSGTFEIQFLHKNSSFQFGVKEAIIKRAP